MSEHCTPWTAPALLAVVGPSCCGSPAIATDVAGPARLSGSRHSLHELRGLVDDDVREVASARPPTRASPRAGVYDDLHVEELRERRQRVQPRGRVVRRVRAEAPVVERRAVRRDDAQQLGGGG